MPFLTKRYVFHSPLKRLLAFIFDLMGALFLGKQKSYKTPVDPAKVLKILVIRLDQIGDVVMSLPAMKALRRQFPFAHIDLLVPSECRVLFQDDIDFQDVYGLKHHWFSNKSSWFQIFSNAVNCLKLVKSRRYDLAIDLRGDVRTILFMGLAGIRFRAGYGRTGGRFLLTHWCKPRMEQHQVIQMLDLIRLLGGQVKIPPPVSALPVSPLRERDFAVSFAPERLNSNQPVMVVHPGAGYPSKQWDQLKYREFIERITQEKIAQIILIGTEEEKKKMQALEGLENKVWDLRGKTQLEDLPVLFKFAQIYIGNDSGPSHVAAAQGLNVIVIFSGTNDYRLWHPWTDKLQIVSYEVPCSPCEAKVCPLGHHDCMEKIEVQDVMEKLSEILLLNQRIGDLR